jgi:hypothetical protein
MRYYRSDVTAVMAGSPSFWKATEYLMATTPSPNACSTTTPPPCCTLHCAPLVYADPDGDTKLAVDQPSLLFASYDNPLITTVGHQLDHLLALLIITMDGDLPSELRRAAS